METLTPEQKVSPDKLTQALQELEVLSKGTEVAPITQEAAPKGDDVVGEAVDARLTVLEKGMETLIILAKQNLEKGNKETETVEGKKKEDEDEETEEGKDKDKKKPTEGLEKGLVTATLTAETIGESPVDLIKGFLSDQKNQVDTFMTQATELIKGQNEVIGDLKQTIETISEESAGRKTITTKNFLQKGNEDLETEVNMLSASTHKRQILDTLTKAAIGEEGIKDSRLATAIMQFEQSNTITQPLIDAVKKEGYSLVA